METPYIQENMSTLPVNTNTNEKSNRVFELEDTINHAVHSIGTNKVEIKKKNTEIKDRLNSNTGYASADEKVKEAQKARVEARKRAISEDEELDRLMTEKKKLQADSKNWQMTLSDYLNEYIEITKQKTVPAKDGKLVDIETISRLKLDQKL